MKENNTSSGMSFLDGLTLVFIGLKLAKVIEWSWWWVFSPMWIPVIILLIILFINWIIDSQ